MSGRFHESLAASEIKPPSARSTGYVFAAVFLILALIFRRNAVMLYGGLGLAALLLALALAAPAVLEPLNRLWFRLSLLLNRIMNPVVMLLMFAIAFVPMGALMRIWRDPLVKRRKPGASTYWVQREPPAPGHSMRNQF